MGRYSLSILSLNGCRKVVTTVPVCLMTCSDQFQRCLLCLVDSCAVALYSLLHVPLCHIGVNMRKSVLHNDGEEVISSI